jgi:hypothetical protein
VSRWHLRRGRWPVSRSHTSDDQSWTPSTRSGMSDRIASRRGSAQHRLTCPHSPRTHTFPVPIWQPPVIDRTCVRDLTVCHRKLGCDDTTAPVRPHSIANCRGLHQPGQSRCPQSARLRIGTTSRWRTRTDRCDPQEGRRHQTRRCRRDLGDTNPSLRPRPNPASGALARRQAERSRRRRRRHMAMHATTRPLPDWV